MNLQRMKAMFTIVTRGNGIALSKLYEQYGVKLHIQVAANGTASSELLNMLGLTHSEYEMLISFGPECAICELMERMIDDYRGILSVRGLCFTIPLTAISGMVAAALSVPIPTEGGSEMPHPEKEHNLILVTVNQGYTDAVMQTAVKAGATGGTVIRGRFVGANHLEQFHSITLQDEKEILVIACHRDVRNPIMDAINAAHGMNTPHQAFVCSLPIDRLVRLT